MDIDEEELLQDEAAWLELDEGLDAPCGEPPDEEEGVPEDDIELFPDEGFAAEGPDDAEED